MKLLILALCIAAAAAAPTAAHRKPPVLCPLRNCYCAASYTRTPVNCTTCTCVSCVAPIRAHVEDCDTTPQPMNPFYLNATAKACVRCTAANCNEYGCDSKGKCIRCAEGFGKNAAGVCVEGTAANCEVVSSRNATLCAQCLPGFALNKAGVCVACPAGCAYCRSYAPSVCLGCAEGQGLVNGVCTACTVDGCASCNGNAAKCTACAKYTAGDASFFILNNGTCVAFPMDA